MLAALIYVELWDSIEEYLRKRTYTGITRIDGTLYGSLSTVLVFVSEKVNEVHVTGSTQPTRENGHHVTLSLQRDR